MRIFVIGGAGYIGTAVSQELVRAGHELVGLARSSAAADRLRALGVQPVAGSLDEVDVLRRMALETDATVQIALGGFLTELEGEGNRRLDRAVDGLISALSGAGKPYLYTSGTGMYGDTGLAEPERHARETDPIGPPYFYTPLIEQERKVLGAMETKAYVIRAGQVYGRGGGYIGPIARRFDSLRRHGTIHAVDAVGGASYVHVNDLARFFRLALQQPEHAGLYNVVNDDVAIQHLCKLIAEAFGSSVTFMSPRELRETDGWAALLDFQWSVYASSDKARSVLGWRPSAPSVEQEIWAARGKDIRTIYPESRYEGRSPSTEPGKPH